MNRFEVDSTKARKEFSKIDLFHLGTPEEIALIKQTYLKQLQNNERLEFIAHLIYRDGTKCWLCGYEITFLRKGLDKVTLDHVVPLRAKEGYLYDNFKLAHGRCNSSRGHKQKDEFNIGLARSKLSAYWQKTTRSCWRGHSKETKNKFKTNTHL